MTGTELTDDAVVEVLGDLIGLKSRELAQHCKRVTAFTVALGRAMKLPGEQLRSLAQGAFLHDVGMIGVPDAVLFKSGTLTPSEVALVREHCTRGYEILKKLPSLAEAAEIVYAHEERYDGTGYPRGLRGEAIPLGARVFSVAHAFDAITTERPYRAARSTAAARDEIASLAGQQFDPQVARTFLQFPDSVWDNLRREVDSPQQYSFTVAR